MYCDRINILPPTGVEWQLGRQLQDGSLNENIDIDIEWKHRYRFHKPLLLNALYTYTTSHSISTLWPQYGDIHTLPINAF